MNDKKADIPQDVIDRLSETIQSSQYFRMIAYTYSGMDADKRREIDKLLYQVYLKM